MPVEQSKKFRVLVVDDSKAVLHEAELIVGKRGRNGDDDGVIVELDTVHVSVGDTRGSDGKPRLTTECLEELAEKVRRNKPNLILLDYGYAKADIGQKMVDVSTTDQCSDDDRKEIVAGLLTAADVRKHLSDRTSLVEEDHRCLVEDFFEGGAPVYVYTFRGPPALQAVIGNVSVRHSPIVKAFPNSKVITIDTHDELYAHDRFESRRETKHHAYLTARLLDWIVVKEAAKFEAVMEEKSKCKRKMKELGRNKKRNAAGAVAIFVAGVALPMVMDTVWHLPTAQNFTFAGVLTIVTFSCVALQATVFSPDSSDRE